jgi:hypothetical protein
MVYCVVSVGKRQRNFILCGGVWEVETYRYIAWWVWERVGWCYMVW